MSESSSAYRCNRRLVDRGDIASIVLEKCGEPLSIRSRYGFRIRRDQGYDTAFQEDWVDGQLPFAQSTCDLLNFNCVKKILVEEWFYDFGKRRGLKVITFEDGVLTGFGNLY